MYTGQYKSEIKFYLQNNGGLYAGEMMHVNGSKVADVFFELLPSGEIEFTVDGTAYDTITDALLGLDKYAATSCVLGSSVQGNAANNVIGNYAGFASIWSNGVNFFSTFEITDDKMARQHMRFLNSPIKNMSLVKTRDFLKSKFGDKVTTQDVLNAISGKFETYGDLGIHHR